ncbi:hypothetical protein MJO28_014706 [Puccinia striiformis f. sp. tritici]|uniref:C2H2-type domain-containing protein n=3 Tax=Puccinia striiformis TaxID=27350 RepID=A0A2S4UEL6_9BASI|nr:hypothetical protein Pst134EB_027595 [Puccinia striiformis f. sp. tritici]KAI9621048.1 hypothetical protein H4Q26_013241 [Puccinia striiformis f. sp. tritici PST-130]POV95641.1 hypothetical protein PSTT_16132 [Puccinia striiformis]KAI7939025.1 hypothetical protein MJO28_014604 [Puccinia striiformis f. sp. tritici]KAI7939127.1 hypothetical protein MJO28_014706 [Puccinia striiformis f. sp. tritici]
MPNTQSFTITITTAFQNLPDGQVAMTGTITITNEAPVTTLTPVNPPAFLTPSSSTSSSSTTPSESSATSTASVVPLRRSKRKRSTKHDCNLCGQHLDRKDSLDKHLSKKHSPHSSSSATPDSSPTSG